MRFEIQWIFQLLWIRWIIRGVSLFRERTHRKEGFDAQSEKQAKWRSVPWRKFNVNQCCSLARDICQNDTNQTIFLAHGKNFILLTQILICIRGKNRNTLFEAMYGIIFARWILANNSKNDGVKNGPDDILSKYWHLLICNLMRNKMTCSDSNCWRLPVIYSHRF